MRMTLKKLLKPGVHGVILSQGYCRATFLPQVWKQLPGTEDFLGHLCQKAGMEKTCWKDTKTAVEVYEVSVFSEKDMKPGSLGAATNWVWRPRIHLASMARMISPAFSA